MEPTGTDSTVSIDILDCCDICGEGHPTELCPELGLNITQTELDQLSTRARLTLPGYVQVVDNGSGLVGVIAKETIPNKTQLGPYEAKRTTHIFDDIGFFTLKLIAKDGTTVCLDTTDENECNWLCLIRAATDVSNKNCMAYQLGNNIFYNTTRDIAPGEEMLVWYAPHFARKLGKPPEPDGETRVLLGHRIEPLAADLLLDTNSDDHTLYQPDGIVETTVQSSVDIISVTQSLDPDKPTGEIRKAFYCPRCGNTFESQTRMVQHLREHVISNGDVPRRGRGRPRKYPEAVNGIVSKGLGSDRQISSDNENGELTFKRPEKTYSRKRKFEEDTCEPEDKHFDDGDDEDDFADKVDEEDLLTADNDSEYSPHVEISISVGRVQPRRSTRGKHSKFDKDYVYEVVKKEVKKEKSESEPMEGISETVNIEVDGVTNQTPSTFGMKGAKRGRGRPRKIKVEEKNDSTKPKEESSGTLTEETVKESLMALKETNSTLYNAESSEHNSVNTFDIEDTKTERSEGILNMDQNVGKDEDDVTEKIELKVTDNINEFEVLNDPMEGTNEQMAIGNESEKSETSDVVVKPETSDVVVSNGASVENGNGDLNESGNNSDLQCQTDSSVTNEDQIDDKTKVENSEGKVTDNEQGDINESKTGANVTDANDLVEREERGSIVIMFEEADDGSYGCALCDEKFTNELNAISHFMNQHNEGDSRCKTCNKVFQNLEELLEHRKSCAAVHDQNLQKETTVEQENGQKDMEVMYECDICKQAFKTPHYLYRHMVIHTDVFKCEKCGNTFSRKDSLQKHVLKCCPELAEKYKILFCEVCLRVFSKESGKKRHKEKCKSVQCGMCMKIFTSEHELSIHKCKNLDMDDSAKYSCGRCSKTFQSLYYLKQHQELHDSHIACDRCGKNFASKDELESHKGLCSTLEGIRLYGSGRCNLCSEVFSNSKVFRNHFMSHTHPFQCEKCEKRFLRVGTLNSHDCEIVVDAVCNICNKTFKNQTNLEKHLKENGCMKYQCSACNEQFRSKSMAKNHGCIVNGTDDVQAEIISISDTREVCPTCGKSFSTKSNLTKHMLLHGEKKYGCPHCSKFFHLDVYLKEHITCVHYKIFKYQCNVCGRLLKSKTGLIAHTRIFHAKNAEVFPCTKCGKVFKQKGNLRSHMYSHSKLRSFKCDMCIKAFKYPDQLSRHKLEHKLSPRLKCGHCDKDFFRTYDLKKHLQIYHSGYIYVCGICSARCGHRHTLVRHYKRKHPENVFLTTQEGYVDGLLKHYSQLYDSSDNVEIVQAKCIVLPSKISETGSEQVTDDSQGLSQEAAEALNSLAAGQVTAKQLQLLKDKGLFVENDGNLMQSPSGPFVQDQGQVIIPQDSYLFEEQTVEQQETLEDVPETVDISSIDNNVGLVQNLDGTVSINGIQGIPRAIEALNSGDGHVVILQIVDPESHDLQGDIVQFNTANQSDVIQLTEEQSKLVQMNADQQGQVINIGQDQQGEIIPLNQNVYEASDEYEGTELKENAQIQTVVISDEGAQESLDQKLVNGCEESEISQDFDTKETEINQSEDEKLDSIQVISLEGGDPNIQAPMVYSEDVTCSDDIG